MNARYFVCRLCIALMFAAAVRGVFGAIPASEYVQRGLAVHFDGIDNAGVGVTDTASTVWKDLTGNGYDLELPGGVTRGEDGGYTFNGVICSFTWPGYQALEHSTTELMMSLPSTYAPSKAALNFGVYSAYHGPWTFGFRTTASPGLLVGTELGRYDAYGTTATMYGSTEGVTLESAGVPTTYAKTTRVMSTRMYAGGQPLTLKSAGATQWLAATDVVTVGARNGAVGTLYACRLYTKVLTDAERAFNRALDSIRFKGVALSEAEFPAGWRVGETSLGREVFFSLSALGSGTVSIADATGAEASAWVDGDDGALVTATPTAGFVFAGWRGDTDGFDPTQASVRVPADRPRSLTAYFTTSGGSYAWTGGGDALTWHDAANWGGSVPGPGASVTIASGTVAIDAPTPHLATLTVGGGESAAKLIVSNWNTKVEADVITVADKGAIALSGGFDDVSQSNRIWLAGTALTVAAGGRISADGGGYLAWCGPSWYEQRRRNFTGFPWYYSSSYCIMYSGASYGGCQGYPGSVTQGSLAGAPYGSAENPTDPGVGGGGSGGGNNVAKNDASFRGGGAILLDFSGTVRIDGTVSALPVTKANVWISGGTGGSVCLHCQTLSGNGRISADAQAKDAQTTYGGSSSGGRIAVHYDVAAQKGVACSVMLSANGGMSRLDNVTKFSEPGTIWMPDAQLLGSPLLHCGRIVVPTLARLDFDSLEVRGRVWWPKDLMLNVSGDLDVVSSNVYVKGMRLDGGALNVGGNVRVAGATLRLGNGCDAVIGGNFTQTDSTIKGENNAYLFSRVYFQAGATNGTDRAMPGQSVRIGGTYSLSSGSTAYFYSHWTNGAISKVSARNVVLNEGAAFNANRGGWAPAKGPGAGNRVERGGQMKSASHGGHGGAFSEALLTQTYGDMKRPLEPGSGAGNAIEGGGVVYIEVTGTMTLNGKISADASKSASSWDGAASGGSVLLDVYKLRGETGEVSAAGGASSGTNKNTGRPGGGGRVAIWRCIDNLSSAVREAVTASAGTAATAIDGEIPVEDGTVYWGLNRKGLMLIVK